MAKDLLDALVTTMRVIHVVGGLSKGAIDSVMAGEKEMQVEGCKSCKSLWLDESNRLDISRGTIVSNEESLE